MTGDDDFAQRLREFSELAAPHVDVDTAPVVPGGRRIRTGRRLATFGGALAVLAALSMGIGAIPWRLGGQTDPASEGWWTTQAYDGGEISEEEYVTIVQAVHDCMIDRGFSVTDVEKRADGLSYSFTIDGGSGPGSMTGLENRLVCEGRLNLAEAEIAYQAQHVLAGAEHDVVFQLFATCMDGAGFPDVSADDTSEQIRDRVATVLDAEGPEAIEQAESCWNMYGALLFGPYV